jgi:hypothetical protein
MMRIVLTLTVALLLAGAAWAGDCGCGKKHDSCTSCKPDCGCAKVHKCDRDAQLMPPAPQGNGDLLPGAECCGRARYTVCCERSEYKLLCPPCEEPKPVCKPDCGCDKCKVRCKRKGCGCNKCVAHRKHARNPVTD